MLTLFQLNFLNIDANSSKIKFIFQEVK